MAPLLDTHGLRVLLYNGEHDMDCNIVGTLAWLGALEWSGAADLKRAPRKLWAPPNAESGGVAGYATTVGNLTQLTLVGAGHMVPLDQPSNAYNAIRYMYSNFLKVLYIACEHMRAGGGV